MASETLTQREAEEAIARLSNVQGILMCAAKTLDADIGNGHAWQVSEAIQAALGIVSDSYVTLNDGALVLSIREA